MGHYSDIVFPAEWEEQDAIVLTWPNSGTDWVDILEEAEQNLYFAGYRNFEASGIIDCLQ
jgi:agmatine/peptidylarginine deiminase